MRTRAVLAFIAAAILVLSSFAHSFLGWRGLAAELEKAHAGPDLVQALGIGWIFGGVAMLAFGAIAALGGVALLQGRAGQGTPLLVIGLAETLFGVAAILLTRSPFFLVFLVPGVLLLAAGRPASGRP